MASSMRALLLTCVLAPACLAAVVVAVATATVATSGRGDFFANYLTSTRGRRELPADDKPVPAGEDDSGLPTCLLCVCLTRSVYCEEISPDMTAVPALPKKTAYLYARFNKIQRIGTADFADIVTLKRIDLTGNLISEIEEGAFAGLPLLEELSLAENRLVRLPALPASLLSFNANHNFLETKGVKATAFKKLTSLVSLYLANNQMEAVPQIPEKVRTLHLQNNNITEVNVDTFCRSDDSYYLRAALSQVRLDGNPAVLSKNPDSFTCMQVLPIGRYR
ncbi:osteoglycin, paralog a [Stigmatopora nigra]